MATIAIATAWNMNVTKERVALNDILLSNVEALAGCETFWGVLFLDHKLWQLLLWWRNGMQPL